MHSDYVTPKCCSHQSIARMDYKWPIFGEAHETRINRICIKCYTHWAGSVNEVKQYTRKEWDALMDEVVLHEQK